MTLPQPPAHHQCHLSMSPESEILAYYIHDFQESSQSSFSNRREHENVRWMVEQLSLEEQQTAAERNYSYWKWHQQPKMVDSPKEPFHPTLLRKASAMREARRHLEGIPTKEMALDLLKASLQYHFDNQTTRYRSCMFATNNSESLSLQQRLHTEMKENQAFVTRGYDTDGHAILFAFSRKQNSGNDADLAFVDAIVYAMERACAATEYHTNGRKDKVVVVIDTQASASPPSLQATKRCAQILQTYYPGRLLKLVVWNPPFVLHALHKCIKPFLDPETASKFVFCKGERQVRDTMDKVLGHGDPSSQFWEVREVDCDHFLNQVPFHSSYCENKQHTAATSAASSRTSSETELQDCPQVGDPSAGPTTAINVNARTLAVGELLHRPGVNEHEDEDQYHVVKLTRVVA